MPLEFSEGFERVSGWYDARSRASSAVSCEESAELDNLSLRYVSALVHEHIICLVVSAALTDNTFRLSSRPGFVPASTHRRTCSQM